MKKLKIASEEIHKAYRNWCCFCKQHEYSTNIRSFLNYIDPVRQTDYGSEDSRLVTVNDPIEVPEQTYRRIMLLAGPHAYATLKANEDRFNHALASWGKKLPKKSFK